MPPPTIVIDTNVIVSGLHSSRGYAYQLLRLVGTGRFDICLSVALLLEYEDVLTRNLKTLRLTQQAIEDVLDYHASVAHQPRLFFLWRPYLSDPKDDLVLELAVNGSCDSIVTFNQRHFRGSERFGVQVVDPRAFLIRIGAAT
jgi:putative PIN family toxin of toxin-antitoxin system